MISPHFSLRQLIQGPLLQHETSLTLNHIFTPPTFDLTLLSLTSRPIFTNLFIALFPTLTLLPTIHPTGTLPLTVTFPHHQLTDYSSLINLTLTRPFNIPGSGTFLHLTILNIFFGFFSTKLCPLGNF